MAWPFKTAATNNGAIALERAKPTDADLLSQRTFAESKGEAPFSRKAWWGPKLLGAPVCDGAGLSRKA